MQDPTWSSDRVFYDGSDGEKRGREATGIQAQEGREMDFKKVVTLLLMGLLAYTSLVFLRSNPSLILGQVLSKQHSSTGRLQIPWIL